jgi:hypothetical protein
MADQFVFVQQEPRGPSQLIEVAVPTNGKQRVPFPDVQQLRSTTTQRIIIKGIRLVTLETLVAGIVTGNPNAVATECVKIAMVIYCEGWEKAQFIPILVLNDVSLPGGQTFPHRYQASRFNNWENVDWTKSYLQYANGTVSAGAPYCVMFEVEYIKLDGSGALIIGPS